MKKAAIYSADPWFPSSKNAFTLFVAITYDCNLKCRHCFATKDGETQTTLDDEKWFMLFDQLAELEAPRLFFTGGEPLKHPSIMRFAAYSSKKSIPIILGTNATLVTPDISKDLFAAGVTEARVSIDGACAATHDSLRRDGSFEQMLKGVNLLISVGISVSVRTTVNKLNYQELDKIGSIVADLGIFNWEIKHIIPAGRASSNKELLTTSQERAIALEKVLEFARTNKYPSLEIKLMEGTLHRDTVIPEAIKVASCPAGSKMMVVQPTGDVIPCGYLSSHIIGNITQKSLKEIREKWKEMACFPLPPSCTNCKHKNICKGGCPAFNFCTKQNKAMPSDTELP